MDITITLNDVDTPIADGFSAATGWSAASGVSQSDWMVSIVRKFILDRARVGLTARIVAPQRDALIVATRAAEAQVSATLPAQIRPIGGIKPIGGVDLKVG